MAEKSKREKIFLSWGGVDWARTSFQIEFAFCLGTSCKAMALPKVSPQKKKQSRFKPNHVHCRVARWFIFKPKIPVWVKVGRPWNGKC
jgi:hypothetical protein